MTVKQIQCLLTYLGYNPGAVDGVNGLKTVAAVLVFQQQEGLRQDGVPGPETQEALLSAVATGRMYTPVMGNQSPDWWRDIRYFKRDEFRCPCGRCGGSRWSRRNPWFALWMRSGGGWACRFPLWTAAAPASGARRTMRRSAAWPILSICLGLPLICTVPQVRRR